jgi:hypothetical protein
MDKKVIDWFEEKMKKTTKDLLTDYEIDLIIRDLMEEKSDGVMPEETED